MKTSQVVEQPEVYRSGFNPEWAWFPALNLLLGMTPTAVEELREALGGCGIKHVRGRELIADPVSAVLKAFAPASETEYDLESMGDLVEEQISLYERMDTPAMFEFGIITPTRCLGASWTRDEISFDQVDCGGEHVLDLQRNYRLVHRTDSDGIVRVELQRRDKRIRPEFERLRRNVVDATIQVQAAINRWYSAAGIPVPDIWPMDGEKTVEERAWASHVERFKKEVFERRLAELRTKPETRPPHFDWLMRMTQEKKQQDMVRVYRDAGGSAVRVGMNPNHGKPQRLYTPKELEDRACHSLARQAATEIMFAFTWTRIATADTTGVTVEQTATQGDGDSAASDDAV